MFFYVVRRKYNNYDDGYKRKELDWTNFEKIINEIEVSRGRRIALREASGEMISPHNTPGCILGTVEVRDYVVPEHKYNKILYIEKRGFLDNIVTDDFHNKFDMAVCAGPGFSSWAIRDLCAKIQANIPITILVAHDCDIAGMNIARTFKSPSPFDNYQLKVIDLGLTPSQVIKDNLEVETYLYRNAFPKDLQSSLSPEDVAWLKGNEHSKPFGNAQRCELNVFTPAQFLAWLERRLDELGIKAKVRPEDEIIEQETRECIKTSLANIVQNSIETIVSTVKNNLLEKFLKQKKLKKISVKKDMDEELADYSNICWDEIIARLAEEEVRKKVSQKEINQDVLEGIKIQLAKARKRKK